MHWGRRLGTTAIFAIFAGCLDAHTIVSEQEDNTDTATARPQGWSQESHGKNAPPNYDTVFSASQVRTMEIVLTDSAYAAMRTDLTSLIGAFRTRQGNQGGPQDTSSRPGMPNGNGIPGDTTGRPSMPNGGAPMDTTGRPPMPNGGTFPADTSGRTPPADSTNVVGPNGVGMDKDAMVDMIQGDPVWVPADLKFGGRTWPHVGLRFKGNSSLATAWQSGSNKLPLRLDADRFEDRFPETKGQRIWGFQKLALNNANGDASLMREMLATEVFRGSGVPSPKAAFVRVVMVHGIVRDTLGVYTMVEIPDDPLLDGWYGSHSGNLYKPEGTGAKFGTMVDSTFTVDAADISDVRAMVAALNDRTTDSAAWRRALEKTFDVPVFLKWLAANTAIQNWDAYGQMAHNFYLYGNHGKLGWIAWDLGLSFQSGNRMGTSMWHGTVDSTWPLIHRLLADSKYRAAYAQDMRSLLSTGYDGAAMSSKVAGWKTMVEPCLTASERTGFAAATTQLGQFPATRIATIRAELDASK